MSRRMTLGYFGFKTSIPHRGMMESVVPDFVLTAKS